MKASGDKDGMGEDDEGPKINYRKIKYLLLHFMPLSPPTLLSLCLHSHASCLTLLVAVFPLVLCCLSFLTCHCLPSGGTSTCPLLVAPPPLVVLLFFSGALASCPPRLFVLSSLITPLPPVRLRLHLSLHHCRAPLVSLVQLVVPSPLITLMPPVHRRLQLLSCHCSGCAPLVPLVHSGWLLCRLSS